MTHPLQVHRDSHGNQMILHKGGKITTIEAIRDVPLPEIEDDSKYGLVPHAAVIETVEDRMMRELAVDRDEIIWTVASNKDGQQFFGIAAPSRAVFARNPEWSVLSPSVAVRNSYDKSTRFAFGIGDRVSVCDNLMISGSDISYSRIHVGEAWKEIELQIIGAMAKVMYVHQKNLDRKVALENQYITFHEGHRFIGEALGRGIITPRMTTPLLKAWKQQDDERYGSRTIWRAMNHVTEALKGVPARVQMPKLAAAFEMASKWF